MRNDMKYGKMRIYVVYVILAGQVRRGQLGTLAGALHLQWDRKASRARWVVAVCPFTLHR